MASSVPGTAQRLLEFGTRVAGAAKTLPAATVAQNLFTVSGGRVVITSLVGTCTTAVQNQLCTVTVGLTPTTGTADGAGLATASTTIAAAEVGSLISLPSGAKGAAIAGVKAGTAGQTQGGGGYVVNVGAITITPSATNTGAYSWALTYVPFDDGASVVAL